MKLFKKKEDNKNNNKDKKDKSLKAKTQTEESLVQEDENEISPKETLLEEVKEDNTLNGLEAMGIKGVSWDELESENLEETKEDVNKRKIILVCLVDTLLIALIILVSIIVVRKYDIKNTREALEVLPMFSKESIEKNASQEMIKSYEFLIHGNHRTPCEKTENGVAEFDFKADGTFIGYNGIYENAEGSYEIKVENRMYVVYIYTENMTNKYSLTINENDTITLTGIDDATPWTFVFMN